MKKIGLLFIILILPALSLGCGASKSEYEAVKAEVKSLKDELTRTRQENESLNRAILEIYREREGLMARVAELEEKLQTAQNRPRPTPQPQPRDEEPEYYQVKLGDTLNRIAEKTGVSTEDLRRLNNLGDSSMIWAGQKLRIK